MSLFYGAMTFGRLSALREKWEIDRAAFAEDPRTALAEALCEDGMAHASSDGDAHATSARAIVFRVPRLVRLVCMVEDCFRERWNGSAFCAGHHPPACPDPALMGGRSRPSRRPLLTEGDRA